MSQTRKQKLREDLQKQRRRRTITTTVILAIVALAVIVGIIIFNKPAASSALVDTPIPQSMYTSFSSVSDSALSSAKSTQVTQLSAVSYSPALTSNSTGPTFLYIGADYCPFCAAERWSILVALSRFGNFTGVVYMLSSPSDNPSSVPTFSFKDATFHSKWITFRAVEVKDRFNAATLQTPTAADKAIWDHFDSGEGIPFIDIGNSAGTHYLISGSSYSGSQYSPTVLSGNWTQIAAQLDNQNSDMAKHINSAADTMITAICRLDGNQPASVCGQSYAQAPFSLGQMPPATNYQSNMFLTLDRSRSKTWTD